MATPRIARVGASRDARQGANWTGILAGTLTGLVIYLLLSVLGMALGIATLGTGGLDAVGGTGGLAIGAALCILVSGAIAAFFAGATAARAAGFVTPAQGRLDGLLTGMLLLLISTLWSFNLLSRTVSQAAGLAGSAIAGVATAGAAGASAAANSDASAQDVASGLGLGSEYRALANGFDRQEVEQIVADSVPELNERQVAATAGVVQGVLRRASNQVRGSLSNPSQIDNVIKQQFGQVQNDLSGAEFTQRLQGRGLSAAQAREVTQAVSTRVNEAQQQAQQAQEQATQAAKSAARLTATAGWLWLLGAGLLLGLATWGGGTGGDRWAKDAPGGDVDTENEPVIGQTPVVTAGDDGVTDGRAPVARRR